MNILWAFGVALIALIGVSLLRKHSPETAQFLPLAAIVLLLIALLPQLGEIVDGIRALSERAGIDSSSLNLVFRGVGIGFVTRIASGICNDCGQRSLGETVDYCGQIAIVSLALPLVLDVAKRISESEF